MRARLDRLAARIPCPECSGGELRVEPGRIIGEPRPPGEEPTLRTCPRCGREWLAERIKLRVASPIERQRVAPIALMDVDEGEE